ARLGQPLITAGVEMIQRLGMPISTMSPHDPDDVIRSMNELTEFNRAFSNDPEQYFTAAVTIGDAYGVKDDTPKALASYRRAIELGEALSPLPQRLVDAHRHLARLLTDTARPAEAVPHAARAVALARQWEL